MNATFVAVLVGVACLVGLCGIVVPVLPGSPIIALAALCWAIWGDSSWGWATFVVVLVMVLAGMTSSMLLTKRDLTRREIPQWPILVGLLCGVVGTFLLPAMGLPIGFVAGLFVAEWVRVGSAGAALSSSLAALKAIGLGMLVELSCAMGAVMLLAVNITVSRLL